MESKILQNESPAERLRVLRDNSERVEVFTYPKRLSGKEMQSRKNELVKTTIELTKLQEEMDNFKEEMKLRKKPLDNELKQNLKVVRSGVEEVTENVYLMADQDEGEMLYYNADGECVFRRPLLKEERQLRIARDSNAV